MANHFDQKEFLDLLSGLAATKGPSLGETQRRKFLEDYLSKHEVDYSVDKAGNVWVCHGRGDWKETVIFDAHMDVVEEGYAPTFEYREPLITGMGVADNLTSVALLALYARYLEINRPLFKRPLKILFSIGEEGEGNLKGIRQVVEDFKTEPYAFVSFDLSFDEYSVAGLGSLRYRADISCPGGHSWGDYGMPSAIDRMMELLMSLKEKTQGLATKTRGELSFNIGTIKGGEGINSIARKAMATFEFRSPKRTILEKMDRAVEQSAKKLNAAGSCDAVCLLSSIRPAADPVNRERLEPHVLRILEELGEKTAPSIRSTNINATLDAGWPSICMGLCTGGRFHTHDEFIRVDSVEKGWRALNKLSRALLL